MPTNHRYHPGHSLISLVISVALFLCTAASAEMRVWEDTSGVPVKAEFVREIFGSVELRRPDGSLRSIPLERLSPEDLEYLRSHIPPDVVLTVRKRSQKKIRNEDFVQAGDIINVVTAKIEVQKKSRAPFTGVLRAEIYLIGKEVATDDYRLSAKETRRVQFTEENKETSSFDVAADFRVYEEYNELETRGAEYAGHLVIIRDSSGNILAVDSDLSWLKGEKIDALRRLYVGAFFDENCNKRSVPRPRYYDARFQF